MFKETDCQKKYRSNLIYLEKHVERIEYSKYFHILYHITGSTKMPGGKTKNVAYAVVKGHNPGIYYTWPDCQREVKGYKGALYKGFTSIGEAKKWHHSHYKETVDTSKSAAIVSNTQERANIAEEQQVWSLALFFQFDFLMNH